MTPGEAYEKYEISITECVNAQWFGILAENYDFKFAQK